MKKLVFILLAVMLVISSCAVINGPKQEVPGLTANLTLHPDEVTVKGIDKTFYFFYPLGQKVLFVSDKKKIYDDIVAYLPVLTIEGRFVMLEGTSINPFTLFEKSTLDKDAQLAKDLNNYQVYKITSYGLRTRYNIQ